nr:hypothetical protein [Tanacetum cinerariifolium]
MPCNECLQSPKRHPVIVMEPIDLPELTLHKAHAVPKPIDSRTRHPQDHPSSGHSPSDHSSSDHSSSDHSSSRHHILGHSISRHTPPVTTTADSSAPSRFVYSPLARTSRYSKAITVGATVTLSIHASRALVPSPDDLLPPCKRFKDFISPEDIVEEDINTDV